MQGNEMAERTLGTNSRNNPGDVKEQMAEITLETDREG
jgi:hypothetical protein